jgi:hypothetical protein
LNEGQERSFPFICIGNKHDLVRSSNSQDLVDEEDVLEMLQRICPPLQVNVPVKKDQKPSAIPSASRELRSPLDHVLTLVFAPSRF